MVMVIQMTSLTDQLRSYSDLINLQSFDERFRYLKLDGCVGDDTFGFDRYLNQRFYHSQEWKKIRDQVIVRDNGCDLGVDGYFIKGRIYIHHMNPITELDILSHSTFSVNPEFLICCSQETHNAIHYGDPKLLPTRELIVRRPNDTCPWKE